MYYSNTTNGFYADEFKTEYLAAGSWPADAVEITDALYQSLMIAQQNGHSIQADASGQPVAVAPVGPSLADQQAMAWNGIKAKRDAIQNGGVEVATAPGVSKWFQTDPNSRIQYLGLKDTARDMLAAGHAMSDALQLNGQPVEWKTFDNSFVALTIQNVFDVVAAVKTLDSLAFSNAETHRAAMLKVADPTTYDYSTGWPPAYPGA